MKFPKVEGKVASPGDGLQSNRTFGSRRRFIGDTARIMAGASLLPAWEAAAQVAGARPARNAKATVLNPRARVPVGLIIDDSTCLVNLNRFAMPQFDEAHDGRNPVYHRNWREWPAEIPDSFVRKFGEWCGDHGVKGKYSIVPYPACVGRLDRFLPGWTRKELDASLELVRSLMAPNWDFHPEMATHTRVIDTQSGQPLKDSSLRSMENWDWTNGRSVEELANYMSYALNILKNAGLNCEGITTPGGFGNRVLPELAQATLQSLRSVFGAEIPHYFRHLFDEGTESVAPRVEYASGLEGDAPKCVVSVIGCTGDWTGGWDCTPPEGADRFISEYMQHGRMVDVIGRGEPAIMVCHWTGIYWNGQELGFKIFQEVVKRLHSRFDNLIWMKTSELSRYWAAKELTRVEWSGNRFNLYAPFACPNFTIRFNETANGTPVLNSGVKLEKVNALNQLQSGSYQRDGSSTVVCVNLPRGSSSVEFVS